MNDSLRKTLEVTAERRQRQMAWNEAHGITPKGVRRSDQASLHTYTQPEVDAVNVAEAHGDTDIAAVLAELESEMLEAADALEFERAAVLRDQIESLRKGETSGLHQGAAKSPNRRRKRALKGKDVTWGRKK